jgi:hypothetical protein
MRATFALIAVAGLSAALAAHDRITTKVTWTRDVAPIVEARCVRCHRPDGPGPMPLTSYEAARPWARAIREEVLARRMPKWHAVRGYGDLLNDPSLSPFEIALLVAWVDGGAPKDLPAAPRVASAPDPASPKRSEGGRERTFPCNNPPRVSGRLLAVRPALERGGSVGIAVRHAAGAQDIVAWIRDFEPEFAETYWLRTPIDLKPGSRLLAQAAGRCSLTIWIDDPSSRRSPPARPPAH